MSVPTNSITVNDHFNSIDEFVLRFECAIIGAFLRATGGTYVTKFRFEHPIEDNDWTNMSISEKNNISRNFKNVINSHLEHCRDVTITDYLYKCFLNIEKDKLIIEMKITPEKLVCL